LFFGVAALLLCAFTWEGSPLNHDEITYLTMAEHMVESGNWLDLDFHGAVVHQRPPLAVWLLAAAGGLGDFSLFATRLPSLVMAWLCLLFVYLLMRELSQSSPLLAPAFLLASALFYFNARRPTTDMTFLAGFCLFLYAYVRASRRPWTWLVAGFAAGWMLMSKGAVTLLPLGAIGLDLLLSPRRRELRSLPLWAGIGCALALALPWHIAQSIRHGDAFWSEYIGFNVFLRATTSLFVESDPLFYLRELWDNDKGTLLLAIVGLAGLCAGAWSNRGSLLAALVSPERLLLLALACTAIPLQLASTRISHYFLPVLPGIMAAAAWTIGRWGHLPQGLGRERLLRLAGLGLAAALFLGNNLPHALSPDYSPDQVRFAEMVRNGGPGKDGLGMEGGPEQVVRVVAVNHYDLAFFYFLGLSPDMITDSERFFTIVDTEPLLHRSRSVRLVPHDRLVPELATGPFFALTEPAHVPLFCGPNGARCGRNGPFRVLKGDYLVLVTNQ
jgi:4-amino-4-deoxy-L-arabinose transferase-like glycosyltransferase